MAVGAIGVGGTDSGETTGFIRSGKGGEVILPGCSRSWSSGFASSLSGLRASALGVVLVLRLGFVLRAMVVVCLRCGLRVVKIWWAWGVSERVR